VGAEGSMSEISQIKVVAPNIAQEVVDAAIQMHGGAGLTNDFPLVGLFMAARALRLADGPDEVHRMVVARQELKKYR
jgi:alkylation response protein AidB-like acyl-CoA dehydrogenase